MSDLKTAEISKWLGVNKSQTDTQIDFSECSDMSNWIITDDYKMQKVFGYINLFASLGAHKINGTWYGSINGTYHFLFACNAHVYEHNLTTHANVDLGTIVDSNPTCFFVNNNTVYILDGTDFYYWSGSGSIATVIGYTPTVFTAAPPTGGGTILEGMNYITGKKSMKFSSKTGVTVYQLPELNIDSFNNLIVNGSTMTLGTHYTVNLINGTYTLVTAVADNVNNVIPTWTKVTAGDRAIITKNKYYGGIYYARMWLYGNPDHLNTRYPSGVTINGVSDPTYWPKFTDSNVGEYEITAIITQYSNQVIFTNGDSRASAWYSDQTEITDPTTGIITTLFPVKPINAKIGNAAKGQVQIIGNNPFTIWKGVFEWVSTYVMNEKNATWKSQRVQVDLDSVDLSKAITVDWDDKGWYMLFVGSRGWVYNYRTDTWFILDLLHAPTCFCIVEKELYFGTENGQIMKFGADLLTFDGAMIENYAYGCNYDFGVNWRQKFVTGYSISMMPEAFAAIDITFETDKKTENKVQHAEYILLDFDNIDFDNFSFDCSYNPQPFGFNANGVGIDYFKWKITSNYSDYSATVLALTIPYRIGGKVRRRS